MDDKYDLIRDGYDSIKSIRMGLPGNVKFLRESFSRMDQLLEKELIREHEEFEHENGLCGGDGTIISEEYYLMQEGCPFNSVFESARLRRLMRKSNLVTICTFFESELAIIVRELIKRTNTRRLGNAPGLTLREFRGNNVCHRCRIALIKYVGISDDDSIWSDLMSFVKLRNTIIHEGDVVRTKVIGETEVPFEGELKAVHSKFKKKGLMFVDGGEMIITPELNEMYLMKVQVYLCDVLDRAIDHFSKLKSV